MWVLANKGRHSFFIKRSINMKRIVIPQMRPVTGSTPEEAANRFNEAMTELAWLHPTFVREGDIYYIQYTVELVQAETKSESYELKGDKATCKVCPHCIRDRNRFGDIDARKVYGTCDQSGERVRLREMACDIYYEERERGSDGSTEECKDQNRDG